MRTIKKIRKFLIGAFIAGAAYPASMALLDRYADSIAVPFKNRSHLEDIFKVEAKKLGIENKKIEVIYDVELSGPLVAYAQKVGQNEYKIVLGPTAYNTSSLKHELYHIADGHCDAYSKNSALGFLTYLFYYEPQSVIYSATGLKL